MTEGVSDSSDVSEMDYTICMEEELKNLKTAAELWGESELMTKLNDMLKMSESEAAKKWGQFDSRTLEIRRKGRRHGRTRSRTLHYLFTLL